MTLPSRRNCVYSVVLTTQCGWLLTLTTLLGLVPRWVASQSLTTATHQVVEWEYQSEKTYANPFREVLLQAVISRKGMAEETIIRAFWAGGTTWKFRFSSPVAGQYTFVTRCNDAENTSLHQQQGALTVTEYTGDHPLYLHGALRVSKQGNYLEHDDGTPFFWLADSWWLGMTERFEFPGGFRQLADDRKKKGFSVIQFAVGFPCDIAPFDPRGQNAAGDPWDSAFKSINPAYFDLVDERIHALLDLGFMPNLVGLWGYYMKWMGPENMKKHWEYLIARYGAYPVTYTLSGETTLAYYPDLADHWEAYKQQFRKQWSEVAAFIKQNDPYQRVLTTHPGPGINDGKNPLNEMQHLDLIMLQGGHQGFASVPGVIEKLQEYQRRFPNQPVQFGEVCFEGMGGSSWQDVQRLLFWGNILQGTYGYGYGVEGIWQFNVAGDPFGPSPTGDTWGNVPWTEAMHYAGSEQLGRGASFLRKLPWWNIRAAPHRANYHADAKNFYNPYVAEMGDDLLFYFTKVGFFCRKPQFMLVGLTQEASYTYTFYDPITGKEYPAQRLTPDAQGQWVVPKPPIMQDWVVWIHRNE